MPIEKQMRFREHVEWAGDQGQLEQVGKYLCSLDEGDWYHFGEL